MRTIVKYQWSELERWSPRLFVLAAVFLLVGAANGGLALLLDGYTFHGWAALILELGRLAALLGTAGLSVRLVDRTARLGSLARVVAALAVVFVTLLTVLATLSEIGVIATPIAIIGLLAYGLSVSTFLIVGTGIIRTGAYSRQVGGLLLVNVVALLIVFFGRLFVPLNLVATVVPGMQVLLYLGVGYSLREWNLTSRQTAPKTTESTLR